MKNLVLIVGLVFLTAGCLEDIKTAADKAGQQLSSDEGRAKVGADLQNTGAAVSTIPHPYAMLGGSVLSLIGTVLIGHKRGKKSGVKAGLTTATRIVDAIEQVKKDGQVDFTDADTIKELNRLLTTDDRALIKDVQGK